MKSNREFTDSVYLKYEAALKAEKQRTAARKKTIKYVTAMAASIIIMIGILGVGLNWDNIFGSGTAMPGNDPVVEQPAEDPLGGAEVINDDDTPQAAPTDADESDADTMEYAAIGGGGAVGLGAIAYYLNRRKKRR